MKSRKVYSILAAAVCAAVATSCVSRPAEEKASAPVPRLKAALFLDDGCRGNGALLWARILARSPEVDLVLLNGKDIRAGKLKGRQLLVCPGGGGARQIAAMKPEGFRVVKKFVEDGGAYLGICAGSYNVMNRKGRFGFLPYDYIDNAHGGLADITAEFNGRGAKLFGIQPGRYAFRYHGGNVMRKTPPTGKGEGEVLAVFKSSVSGVGRPACNFIDKPAVVFGSYGKGKALAISFHPESYEATHDVALGAVYALTGVRPVPVLPCKVKHPVRVGFLSLACVGPRAAREMIALDRNPKLDIDIFSTHELRERGLHHYDVLVLPAGEEKSYKKLMANEFNRSRIMEFLDRGGRIVASGNGAKYLPEHQNVKRLRTGADFAPALLEK
jgi:glutamine amidotransferase PdxT